MVNRPLYRTDLGHRTNRGGGRQITVPNAQRPKQHNRKKTEHLLGSVPAALVQVAWGGAKPSRLVHKQKQLTILPFIKHTLVVHKHWQ